MPIISKDNDDYIYIWVGKNLKKQRKLKGWTQSQLARECNYTDTFISNIENNTFQTFSLNTLYHIAKVMQIDMRLLFEPLDAD